MSSFGQQILDFFRSLIILLPGLAVGVILHEYAHGLIAFRMGDPTAKNHGRLTLNPKAHIDLFGSILLPLLLILLNSGIVFGYAKPVPINPGYFKDYRKGMRYTSLAGPVANLILAFALGLIYGIFFYLTIKVSGGVMNNGSIGARTFIIFNEIFSRAVYINIFLAVFNFIPIPPLDGSKILASFLPNDMMHKYLSFGRYGFFLIFILLFVGGGVFWTILSPVFTFLNSLCTWWQYLL